MGKVCSLISSARCRLVFKFIFMKREILVIVPTRSRPDNVKRMIESWKQTTQGKSLLLFIMDHDDLGIHRTMKTEFLYTPGVETATIYGERKMMNAKHNEFCLGWGKEGVEVISSMGDDCVFLTPGWEDKVLEWQREHKGICYCNDLLQGENLPTFAFIHIDIVEALGYLAPPVLQHYYIDNYWKDLGIKLGKLKYFPEIVIEHRHWSAKKAVKDELYTTTENALMGKDRESWDKYRESELANDVQKIKEYGRNKPVLEESGSNPEE